MIKKLLNNAVAWIGVVLVAAVASHALKLILEFINKRFKGPNHLIALIEIIMLLIIGIVVFHEYFHPHQTEGQPNNGHVSFWNSPAFLVLLMVLFGLTSILLYTLYKKAEIKDKEEK